PRHGERKAKPATPFIERRRSAETGLNQRRQRVFRADSEHGPIRRAIDDRTFGDDDTRFAALSQGCMQQRRDGGGEARAIACHDDRVVRRAYLEAYSAVVALMHITRHVSEKRREIELLPCDREFV